MTKPILGKLEARAQKERHTSHALIVPDRNDCAIPVAMTFATLSQLDSPAIIRDLSTAQDAT